MGGIVDPAASTGMIAVSGLEFVLLRRHAVTALLAIATEIVVGKPYSVNLHSSVYGQLSEKYNVRH